MGLENGKEVFVTPESQIFRVGGIVLEGNNRGLLLPHGGTDDKYRAQYFSLWALEWSIYSSSCWVVGEASHRFMKASLSGNFPGGLHLGFVTTCLSLLMVGIWAVFCTGGLGDFLS